MSRVFKAVYRPKNQARRDEYDISLDEVTITFTTGEDAAEEPHASLEKFLRDLYMIHYADFEISEVATTHSAAYEAKKALEEDGQEPGMYRITYQRPGGRVILTSQMLLFAVEKDQFEGVRYLFSARPRFGTQTFRKSSILTMERLPDDAEVFVSWDARNGPRPAARNRWKHER